MADTTSNTARSPGGTDFRYFHADADAFDGVIDAVHTAIDAESLIGLNPFDPSVAGLAAAAADAWAVAEEDTVRFLDRPGLCRDHILAGEHLCDVLRSEEIGEVHGFIVPLALTRAAVRNARRRDARSVTLARQLNSISALLRFIIEEARADETGGDPMDATDDEADVA